ncbi:MAG: hypothetical protein QOG26_325, partial [Solirubrobacterales bacterium]|nr:hypothetical protein [Solirubrobacterales bacterium]
MAFHPQRCLALVAGLSAAVAIGACGGVGPGTAKQPPPVADVRVVRA